MFAWARPVPELGPRQENHRAILLTELEVQPAFEPEQEGQHQGPQYGLALRLLWSRGRPHFLTSLSE